MPKPPPPQARRPLAPELACHACRHWKPVAEMGHGECRRLPPAVVTPVPASHLTASGPRGLFPLTTSDCWCGEHRPRD